MSRLNIREWFGHATKVRREELAEKAGIQCTSLSDVEPGTRNPSLVNIERLAEALSMCMAALFEAVEKGS